MIRGIFSSHSGLPGDRIQDLSSRVLTLGYTGTAPLLALSSGMPKEPAGDTAYTWVEDSHVSGMATSTAAVNTVATGITVDDSNIWVENTVIMNQNTGEYMLITGINSDTSITVQRAIGGTVATAVAVGNRFQSVGTAYAEGSGKPSPVAQRGEQRSNYVQIFKNGWAITGTAKAVKYRSGSQVAMNRQQALGYHLEDLERSFIWGRPYKAQMQGKNFRMSGGIAYQIETFGGIIESAAYNGTAGNMSIDGLTNFMRRIFDRNVKGIPNERVSFTSSAVLELVNRMCKMDSRYNLEGGETEYGIKVAKLVGLNGDLKFMVHPMFTENPLWNSELHVYHPGLIKKRVLRDTWEETFGASSSNNNGVDAEEGYIALETGWQAQAVETMGIMRNINKAVQSAVVAP